jgi:hypothetical protein
VVHNQLDLFDIFNLFNDGFFSLFFLDAVLQGPIGLDGPKGEPVIIYKFFLCLD